MKYILIIILVFVSSISLYAEKEWVNVYPPIDKYEENMGLYCYDDINCISFSEVNDLGYIKKANNGGKSWYVHSEIYYSDTLLQNILTYLTYTIDSNNIYTRYYNKIEMDYSNDGGRNFKKILFGDYSGKKGFGLYGFEMFNNNLGVAYSHRELFITNDNWLSYEVIEVPNDYLLQNYFYFLDSNSIIIPDFKRKQSTEEYTFRYMKYTISTKEWSIYSIVESSDPVLGDPIVLGVNVLNDSVIYACGFIEKKYTRAVDVVWKSTDSGKSWKRVLSTKNIYPSYGGLESIKFRNENHGITCTDNGTFYETIDGGQTWFLYPLNENLKGSRPTIAWAGETLLFTASQKGIFRLETKSSVTEVSNAENIKVRKSSNSLEIAINDESFANYNFQLYNISGQVVNTSSVKSSMGYIFQTIELPDMINGVYYYVLSSNNSVYNGKLIVIE